jgi:hypothetical protein
MPQQRISPFTTATISRFIFIPGFFCRHNDPDIVLCSNNAFTHFISTQEPQGWDLVLNKAAGRPRERTLEGVYRADQ